MVGNEEDTVVGNMSDFGVFLINMGAIVFLSLLSKETAWKEFRVQSNERNDVMKFSSDEFHCVLEIDK